MKNERQFLHDLVGPLSTAKTHLEILIEELSENQVLGENKEKLQSVLSSLEKTADLIRNRREELIAEEERLRRR